MNTLDQTDQATTKPLTPSASLVPSHIGGASRTMFCEHCGQSVFADAVLCVHCGRQTTTLLGEGGEPAEVKRVSWHISEMIGLLMLTVFFFPPFGFYYGWVGLKEPGKGRQGKVLLVVAGAITLFYLYVFHNALTPTTPLTPSSP